MRALLRTIFPEWQSSGKTSIHKINLLRAAQASWGADELRDVCRHATSEEEVIAATAVVAKRELGLELFDVQLRGALALTKGRIAEMQTGEGKTLAAVPAIVWYARAGRGVHVMTVNDYLARRDAEWMGRIYNQLGFSVSCIQQGMSAGERRAAYACDLTYSTANEIGFDYLRDQLALNAADRVHRSFATAVIDEADSILIDEARIPLVIAGGAFEEDTLPLRADFLVRHFRQGIHFHIEQHFRNISLTDQGIQAVESRFGCGNLFAEESVPLLTAVQDAVHAHALLRRDVDYVVKNGNIESVDEFKGRVAQDRRWPAGLHTAIEAKEHVALKTQGRVLGSITLQNLIALYPEVCGMTGTAATQAGEFLKIYGLDVEVIPPNRPMIRSDYPDSVYRTLRDKELAVIAEIRSVHLTGRPVLIGTASVRESERLSALLQDIPHEVLNAKNEEREAALIARAGERGAVTISTNIAGRGTDIKLGEGVAAIGGLHIVGTNRHEARRIDFQLRGRAGRQGDPGSSHFIVSLEDDIMVRYGEDIGRLHLTPESVQRIVEGKNLEIRLFLEKYEGTVEGQRQMVQAYREERLRGVMPEFDRIASLRAIDDLWSEHLAEVAELRSGVQLVAWTGRDPLFAFLTRVDGMFRDLMEALPAEMERRIAAAREEGIDPSERGATWTYLTTDNPFGKFSDRVRKGIVSKIRGWGS